MNEPERTRDLRLPLPVDLGMTLSALTRGLADPAVRLDADGSIWRASWTRQGPVTQRLARVGEVIRVSAWGAGAAESLEHAPELLGSRDSLAGFAPEGIVARLHRRLPGLRIPRSGAVFERLLTAIVGQKVSGKEALNSRFALSRAWGQPAPGPVELRLPPHPEELATRRYYEFHPFGIERRRAETIISAARAARRLEQLVTVSLDAARARLLALPGVGPWSVAEVMLSALGDADAVSVGDYNLPSRVAFTLAGEERADDARMLELLDPFAGHRGRVQRLIECGGVSAPRRGPRRALRDFRSS